MIYYSSFTEREIGAKIGQEVPPNPWQVQGQDLISRTQSSTHLHLLHSCLNSKHLSPCSPGTRPDTLICGFSAHWAVSWNQKAPIRDMASPSLMVKIGRTLLFHVADRKEGGSRGQGHLTAQRTAHAASSGAAHAALRLDTLLPPCVSCCPQPRLRAASPLQQSPLCPRHCRSQRGASGLRQVSKVEGRVMVSDF